MKAKIIVKKDHLEASEFAAELVAKKFNLKENMTVTFAAGDTPLECYKRLIEKQGRGGFRLDRARYIGLDEWVGLGERDAGSCIETMNRSFYVPAGIPRENIIAFDGLATDVDGEVARMQGILESGGIELAVLGVGVNGHVGFNEPGPELPGYFSLVTLAEATVTVGRKYFAGKPAPGTGATTTLAALKRAETVIVLATGISKRQVVAEIISGETGLPAGAFLEHEGAYYIFDEESAGTRKF